MDKQRESRTGLEIAVIGMTAKFPGARNIDEFWDNLKNGVESVSFFSAEELVESGLDSPLIEYPDYVNACGVLENNAIETFDSYFFDYLPKEAEMLDPQMRLFYQCAWEVVENAGYDPGLYKGLVGVFAGASANFNWEAMSYLSGSENQLDYFSAMLLSDKDFLSTSTSYKLNLKGPAFTLQTACSTSLVAVHQACRALLTGECDMALAGGVTINIPQKRGYLYKEGMVKSPDGHCRAFDEKANGTVGGNGIGIVVLKRLNDAIADRDEIHAVIKGSAINNDGNRKVGYTAPSVEGQVEVIKAAQQVAEVEPESITYIETHGTGTELGDPVEIEALKRAFNTGKSSFCGLGSVKTNVGHLDSAAGVAGFIKTVLALKHHLIPPSLHFEIPNSKIDFENSSFFVTSRLQEWKNDRFPLRAGVSSFGIGGTNAHVILEEAPQREISSGSRDYQLILVSAKTGTALERASKNLGNYLKKNPGINLADTAYTLQVGRSSLKHRKMLVCSTVDEAVEELLSTDSEKVHTFLVKEENRPVIFMFPGQGSQYVGMGLDLYKSEPLFREEMNRCFEILISLMGFDIRKVMYPREGTAKNEKEHEGGADINQTEVTQPVIFAFEYALAKFLMKLGIKPYAMIGHSIGEYVAACLSGVFSLEDALQVVSLRSRLMQQIPPGAMLSVSLSEKEIRPLLTKFTDISLAAVNGPSLCVASGPYETIDLFEKKLQEKGHKTRILHTSHAFHSRMMDPILMEFERSLGNISLSRPEIPYISNITGKWITVEDAIDPRYWARHIRETVRFASGLEVLLGEAGSIFVEVGPGTALSTFTRQYLEKKPGYPVLNLVRHKQEDVSDLRYLLIKLGQLWLFGKTIAWDEFYKEEKRNRIPLPTYPFDTLPYPVNVNFLKSGIKELANKPLLEKKSDIADWFYVPLWEKSIPTVHPSVRIPEPLNWLIFIDEEGIGLKLMAQLELEGQNISVVKAGAEFKKTDDLEFVIRPQHSEDYGVLFKELQKSSKIPNKILHLWGVSRDNDTISGLENIDRLQNLGFYSLLHTAQAIGKEGITGEIQLAVITTNVQEVTGEEYLCPGKATILGVIKVIPLEYPNIKCSGIDIVLPVPDSKAEAKLIDQLLTEFKINTNDSVKAIRGSHSWIQTFNSRRFEPSVDGSFRLRQKGVYLITGGLGGIGFTLAEDLAKRVKARLILTGRSSFPERDQWNEWLDSHAKEDLVSRKIRKVQEMEATGAEVFIVSADVANLQQMQNVLDQAIERFTSINGVIHAAGIPGGAMIQGRSLETSTAVFDPKLRGTLVLDRILKDKELDFFVLCSSLSSVIAPLGQVAYSAANAFLDAFAYSKIREDGTFIVSINWDTWQEVGMAVAAVRQREGDNAVYVAHPLLGRYISKDSAGIFINRLSVEKHWVLDEHRILGKATLPGTTYLEMVRAAFENHTKSGIIEISDLYFLQPMVVEDDEEKEVRIILRNQENHFEFFVISRLRPGEDEWQEHARGKVAIIEGEQPGKNIIKDIESQCSEQEIDFSKERQRSSLLKFGPRWETSKRVKLGKDQGLVTVKLPDEFSGDLHQYKIHPALLDTALAGVFQEGAYFLPFSYKKVKIYGALPKHIFSHIRCLDNGNSQREFKNFKITIMDDNGVELMDIDRYTLKTIPEERIQNQDVLGSLSVHSSSQVFKSGIVEKGSYIYRYTSENLPDTLDPGPLTHGLLPNEGVEVFQRILSGILPQVVVSTIDFAARWERRNTLALQDSIESLEEPPPSGPAFARPELSTKYVKPERETEKKLANIFQKFLGIEQIGINDNFFELGANSLTLVQVNSQLQKELGQDISVVNIYAYPTIKSLGEFLHKGELEIGISEEEAQRLKTKTEKGKDKLKHQKQIRKGVGHDT